MVRSFPPLGELGASSMLQLFFGAMFGLLAGLVGTGFQAYLQRKDKADERLERRRELKRDKAELVFREMSELVTAYSDLHVNAIRYIGGRPEAKIEPASNAKISALLLVYFPECVPLLDEFDKDMKKLVEEMADELRKDSAYLDGDKVKTAMVVQALKASQRASKFSDDLRPRLREEIQKLW